MSAPLPSNQTRGPDLLTCQWVTTSIASLLVFLRIYTRTFLGKTAGADDWTIVIALVFAIAQTSLATYQVDSGFGRHIEYLHPDQISNIRLGITVIEVLHTIGTFLVRASVCLFILRLVPRTHRKFRRYTYVLIAVFAVITTATFLLILLACIPIQGSWDMQIKAHCIARSDLSIIARTQGVFSAVMDFVCVGLPMFFLWNLQARFGEKISLFVLLALGLFTAVCAIFRTATISFKNEDFTWHQAPVAFWASLEQNIGIIVASLPAMHQLYAIVLEKFSPGLGRKHSNVRPLRRLTASSGYMSTTSNGSHNDKIWLGRSRGSQSIMMMSNADADADGGAGAGMIVPGPLVPPSPSKKEPRTDYDSPTLEISPNLEQAAGAVATRDEGFYYRGGC